MRGKEIVRRENENRKEEGRGKERRAHSNSNHKGQVEIKKRDSYKCPNGLEHFLSYQTELRQIKTEQAAGELEHNEWASKKP